MCYTICQTTFILFSQYFLSSPIVYASRPYIAIVGHPLTLLSWPLSPFLLQHHKALPFLIKSWYVVILHQDMFCFYVLLVLPLAMNVYWMLFVYDRLLGVWWVELSGLWEWLSSASNTRQVHIDHIFTYDFIAIVSTFFTHCMQVGTWKLWLLISMLW